jgi:hypothetical protein
VFITACWQLVSKQQYSTNAHCAVSEAYQATRVKGYQGRLDGALYQQGPNGELCLASFNYASWIWGLQKGKHVLPTFCSASVTIGAWTQSRWPYSRVIRAQSTTRKFRWLRSCQWTLLEAIREVSEDGRSWNSYENKWQGFFSGGQILLIFCLIMHIPLVLGDKMLQHIPEEQNLANGC